MDQKKVISRYNLTLELLRELELKNKPAQLKKGESFIDYGEKTQKIGILINGLMYSTYIAESGTEWVSPWPMRKRSVAGRTVRATPELRSISAVFCSRAGGAADSFET